MFAPRWPNSSRTIYTRTTGINCNKYVLMRELDINLTLINKSNATVETSDGISSLSSIRILREDFATVTPINNSKLNSGVSDINTQLSLLMPGRVNASQFSNWFTDSLQSFSPLCVIPITPHQTLFFYLPQPVAE